MKFTASFSWVVFNDPKPLFSTLEPRIRQALWIADSKPETIHVSTPFGRVTGRIHRSLTRWCRYKMDKNKNEKKWYNHPCECMPRNASCNNNIVPVNCNICNMLNVRWHSSNTHFITFISTRNEDYLVNFVCWNQPLDVHKSLYQPRC